MIYGYIRVSTDRQTVENQRYEIKRFCQENNLQVDKWISETISGAKEVDKRRLGKLLKDVRKDDIIICSEISRLGRSLFMIMSVLNHCMEIGAKVWTIKDNYRLGQPAHPGSPCPEEVRGHKTGQAERTRQAHPRRQGETDKGDAGRRADQGASVKSLRRPH